MHAFRTPTLALALACMSALHAQVNVDWAVVHTTTPGAITGPVWAGSLGATGEIAVVFDSLVPPGFRNIETAKYSSTGALQWIKLFDSGATIDDRPQATAMAPNGDLCVCGYARVTSSNYDLIALRYDADAIRAGELWGC